MLFESSEEMGGERGLGVLPGRNVRLRPSEAPGAPRLKVPHIGWNAIEPREGATLFQGLPARPQVYFVHSYFPEPGDPGVVSATCEHGQRFCAAVEHGNVHATQFHPEKSGAVGLAILRNFASLAA
jgi:glutamine amidotransferase